MASAVVDPWSALGDPTRREVLAIVAERPRSVAEIAALLPVSRPAVSQHLKVLGDALLVTAQQDGRKRIYHPRSDGLAPLRADLERLWTRTLHDFKQIAEEATP